MVQTGPWLSVLRTPPDPGSFRPRDMFEFAYLMKKFYELSESQIYEFIRFFTMSIAEYLENYFENEAILAHYSGGSIIGTGLGVYSPGTAYVLLHHAMGDVDGNIGCLGICTWRHGCNSWRTVWRRHFGPTVVKFEWTQTVARIIVSGNKTTGVELASGEKIRPRKPSYPTWMPKRTFTQVDGREGFAARGGRACTEIQDSWLVRESEYCAGRYAYFPVAAEGLAANARSHAFHRYTAASRESLRRLEGRSLVGRPLLRHADSFAI